MPVVVMVMCGNRDVTIGVTDMGVNVLSVFRVFTLCGRLLWSVVFVGFLLV